VELARVDVLTAVADGVRVLRFTVALAVRMFCAAAMA
jgi:hypothetical protein